MVMPDSIIRARTFQNQYSGVTGPTWTPSPSCYPGERGDLRIRSYQVRSKTNVSLSNRMVRWPSQVVFIFPRRQEAIPSKITTGAYARDRDKFRVALDRGSTAEGRYKQLLIWP